LIATNVQNDHQTSNKTTICNIASVAEQSNSYIFDEATALRTYKKMMTLHLKEDMFWKLKFITNHASMLEFLMQENSLYARIRLYTDACFLTPAMG
jgi:hypothetical protein